jgi:lysozyme
MKTRTLFAAALILGASFATASPSLAAVCAAGETLQGIDVSMYQGSVDWTKVKASGIAFAFARLSDGSFLDPDFDVNWKGIKAAGMVRGAYQFFEPGEDPIAQANIVLQKVGMLQPGDLPVVLDLEVTGGQSAETILDNAKTWIAHVQGGTGRVPMIYTAVGFWNADVGSAAFSGNPLWAANWQVTCPNLAEGWANWAFWQYSDNGTVSGIPATVDLDEYNGSMADLLSLATRPSLNIALSGGKNISLTWSTLAAGFLLQEKPVVNLANWVTVTNGPNNIVGNRQQVILERTNHQGVFRLYHP